MLARNNNNLLAIIVNNYSHNVVFSFSVFASTFSLIIENDLTQRLIQRRWKTKTSGSILGPVTPQIVFPMSKI